MIYYTNYNGHDYDVNGRKHIDSTIYTFDIETSSYLILDGKTYPAIKYDEMSDEDKEKCIKQSNMYIWMFGINDVVYYGRTWNDLKIFLNKIEKNSSNRKILFIHNFAFEFHYMKSYFNFKNVFARKSRKVISAEFSDYNMEIRCSYMMSNCGLKYLPDLFGLPTQKMVGDLDYTKIRTSITKLSEKEMKYCENDCLVLYYYIKRELETYERNDKIPKTSTGHVRRELMNIVMHDASYRRRVQRSVNTNPLVYNRLVEAFMGGYTHASWVYADEIIEDVDSWDFTSSYPYVLVTHRYPAGKFKLCNIKRVEQMNRNICYMLVVKFRNIKSKYYNNFISSSKCRYTENAKYDNGRLISAEELEITLTDVDFYLILDSYDCDYEIEECWYTSYNYLPLPFINFVLEKYVNKTKFKNVVGKELEYQKEKNKFNSLYGMSVTNNIRDNVIFDNETKQWIEEPISDDDIIDKLKNEENKGFMSFAWGVWVTAYARNNLIRNIMKLDDYLVYS